VSDLYSPVTGEVVAANGELANDPASVNSDPYGKGWMIKLRVADESELDQLLGPEEYSKHIGH
jgi:glycine cleavage system H protein